VNSSTLLKVITGATILGNLSVAYFSYHLFIADKAVNQAVPVPLQVEVQPEIEKQEVAKKSADSNESAVDSWSDANILSADGGFTPVQLGRSY
jgi:hypothetical protein